MKETKKLVSNLHWKRERERYQMSIKIDGYEHKDAKKKIKKNEGKMHHANVCTSVLNLPEHVNR